MSILDLAASPLLSGALGALGSIATGVLTFFQRKQDHEFALAEARLKLETMKLQGELDAAKLAGILAAEREKGAADAFTASQQAETALGRSQLKFTAFLREGTRPLLTWWFQAFTLTTAACIVAGWAVASLSDPLLQYIVVSQVNAANMTTSWWFGQRQIDKVTIAWGNRAAGARVGSATQAAGK